MVDRNISATQRVFTALGMLLALAGLSGTLSAQAPTATAAPAATASASQRGTVKSIAGNTLTITTDAGQTLTVNIAANAKLQQLAVGSTDLKAAQASQFSDITLGDRVLATARQAMRQPA